MSAPRKFDEETRARAFRLYQERLRDHGESKLAARRHVGQLLDINPATLRNWIEADERAAHSTGGSTTTSPDDAAELRLLRPENAELRRANETSHASILSSGAPGRPTPTPLPVPRWRRGAHPAHRASRYVRDQRPRPRGRRGRSQRCPQHRSL